MSNQSTARLTAPTTGQPSSQSGTAQPTPPVDHLEYWKAGFRELKTFRGHSHSVWSVAYAPDGQTIVSGGVDRYVRIWDIETGRLLRSLRGHTADIRALVFTPDGRTLASGSEDRAIRLWNPKTGEPTKLLFTRYDHNVCSLSLSPDGLMLARGSHNKDIKIWEVTTGTDLMTLLGKDQYDHHWSVCVAFLPDGVHLASGSDIGKIKLRDFRLDHDRRCRISPFPPDQHPANSRNDSVFKQRLHIGLSGVQTRISHFGRRTGRPASWPRLRAAESSRDRSMCTPGGSAGRI